MNGEVAEGYRLKPVNDCFGWAACAALTPLLLLEVVLCSDWAVDGYFGRLVKSREKLGPAPGDHSMAKALGVIVSGPPYRCISVLWLDYVFKG